VVLRKGDYIMHVKIRFTGLMRHYARESERIYEFPEGSTVGDLLQVVGKEYGPKLPLNLWDPEKQRFHPTIVATRKGAPAMEEEEPLKPGDEIYILSRMAGG
jgi:molybdopterin converting factor small subunit